MLSDASIDKQLQYGRLVIDPLPPVSAMQPASVDLTLGDEFMSPYDDSVMKFPTFYTLLPGECVLATTAERLVIPNDMVARVEGKSTWGRRFLMVHSTAGFIDPGFRGQITLELKNLSKVRIVIPIGARIAQVSFEWLDLPALRPYGSNGLGSHYQDQRGVVGAAT